MFYLLRFVSKQVWPAVFFHEGETAKAGAQPQICVQIWKVPIETFPLSEQVVHCVLGFWSFSGSVTLMPRTKRSKLQKAHSIGNLDTINANDKENEAPSVSSGSQAVSEHILAAKELEIKCQRATGKEYEHRYCLEHWKLKQSQGKGATLHSEASLSAQALAELQNRLSTALALEQKLHKEKDTLRKRSERAPVQRTMAVGKAVQKAKTHQLQQKGAITEPSREMVRELVQLGLPVASISGTIHAVNNSQGVTTHRNISRCTAS